MQYCWVPEACRKLLERLPHRLIKKIEHREWKQGPSAERGFLLSFTIPGAQCCQAACEELSHTALSMARQKPFTCCCGYELSAGRHWWGLNMLQNNCTLKESHSLTNEHTQTAALSLWLNEQLHTRGRESRERVFIVELTFTCSLKHIHSDDRWSHLHG